MSKTKTTAQTAKSRAAVNKNGGFVGRDCAVNRLLFYG
jgi:hypothetical protein